MINLPAFDVGRGIRDRKDTDASLAVDFLIEETPNVTVSTSSRSYDPPQAVG